MTVESCASILSARRTEEVIEEGIERWNGRVRWFNESFQRVRVVPSAQRMAVHIELHTRARIVTSRAMQCSLCRSQFIKLQRSLLAYLPTDANSYKVKALRAGPADQR